MFDEKLVIFEYEQVLLKRKLNFKISFNGDLGYRKRAVGAIWRYAVTNLLHWTPQEAEVYMTQEIVLMLHLEKTLNPLGIPASDLKYIYNFRAFLQYAFPDQIKYDDRQEVIDLYKRSAKLEEWENDPNSHQIKKKFFLGIEGQYRAKIVLDYLLKQYFSDSTVDELYEWFANTKKAKKWLKSKKVDQPISSTYSPLDFLHDSLSIGKKDEFLYYNQKINAAYAAAEKKYCAAS